MRSLLLLFIWFIGGNVFAKPVNTGSKQVIDLGVLEVQGKLRGPEIQLIDSNQMGEEALLRTSRMELKKLEQELLKPRPFSALRNQREQTR